MMAEFVGHEPCPGCGSKDNLARYNDGSAYCFGCQYSERPSEGQPVGQSKPKNTKGRPLLTGGEHSYLKRRRLSEETCKKFDYRIDTLDGRTVQVANFKIDGKTVA